MTGGGVVQGYVVEHVGKGHRPLAVGHRPFKKKNQHDFFMIFHYFYKFIIYNESRGLF